MSEFDVIGNFTFHRQQPREWRDIPFDSGPSPWRVALRIIGIIVLWFFIVGVALWSISQSVPAQHITGGKQ